MPDAFETPTAKQWKTTNIIKKISESTDANNTNQNIMRKIIKVYIVQQ